VISHEKQRLILVNLKFRTLQNGLSAHNSGTFDR
jgi:hypothetical protein